jgi:TonB family protein
MGRLQSGLLLFETPQGLVRVELSFRDRLYLLWTFRNFRRLSTLLLNSRENTLINTLYHNNSGIIQDSYDPAIVIGVVEDYVPAAEVEAVVPQEQKRQPERKRQRDKKRRHTPVAPPSAEVAPITLPDRSVSTRAQWPNAALAKLIAASPAVPEPARAKASGFKMSRLLSSFGVLSLCVVSMVAWHRIEAVPSSEAENRPDLQQISAMAPASAPQVAEPVAAPVTPQVSETIAVPPTNSTDAIAQALSTTPIAPQPEAKPTTVAGVVPTPSVAPPAVPTPSAAAERVPARDVATPVVTARVSTPKSSVVHNRISTPTVPVSFQNASIQATRPPLRYVYPEYSEVRARGVVALTAGVDSDGKVCTVKVLTGNRALAAAAVRAVRQWRYRPYLKDGQPIATETNIVISFISDDAVSISFPSNIPVAR